MSYVIGIILWTIIAAFFGMWLGMRLKQLNDGY